MMEEHFYFLLMHDRWFHKENFWIGPYKYFGDVPAPIRPLIARLVRRRIRKTLWGHGIGRHSETEKLELAIGDLNAIELLIGNQRYILGDTICEADASVFSLIWAASCNLFESPIADHIRSRPILMTYLKRIRDQFFPEFEV
jgi:glutathione S-transferase